MTLAQIMKLALRQLDEDVEDISEHAELFKAYANEGNQIVMNDYYQPRDVIMLRSDEDGRIWLDGMGILRVISLTDAYGCSHPVRVAPDGTHIDTGIGDKEFRVVCQLRTPMLVQDQDVPPFPEEYHFVLADYICYRKLVNGNAAKQARARAYHDSFVMGCRRVRPQGSGSVTQMHGLYAASSIHARR